MRRARTGTYAYTRGRCLRRTGARFEGFPHNGSRSWAPGGDDRPRDSAVRTIAREHRPERTEGGGPDAGKRSTPGAGR